MKSISVGELRQNPTAALDAVEHGETLIVTRHRREIGRLVPPRRNRPVRSAEFHAALRETPLTNDWAEELAAARTDFDDRRDPWASA